MYKSLPSRNLHYLRQMLGQEIATVKRQVFIDDLVNRNHEELADGPIEIHLKSGTIIHFVANTEPYSVGVCDGKMPEYGQSYKPIDVTGSEFWKSRINHRIESVRILRSKDSTEESPCEIAIEIKFDNNKEATIEYLSDEEHLDMIRVIDRCSADPDEIERIPVLP